MKVLALVFDDIARGELSAAIHAGAAVGVSLEYKLRLIVVDL